MDSKEIFISTVKSIFGIVPFAGNALDEVVFEYRGRVKQNRLNQFVELLSEFFSSNQDVDLENLKSEDFGDLFESVLKRVVQTKSLEKQKRFRDVLIRQIVNSSAEVDNSEIYLDLISSLSEDEIRILYHHRVFPNNFTPLEIVDQELHSELNKEEADLKKESELKQKGVANNYSAVVSKISDTRNKIADNEKKRQELQKIRAHEFYELTELKFLYYKQSLFSKGLFWITVQGQLLMAPSN